MRHRHRGAVEERVDKIYAIGSVGAACTENPVGVTIAIAVGAVIAAGRGNIDPPSRVGVGCKATLGVYRADRDDTVVGSGVGG